MATLVPSGFLDLDDIMDRTVTAAGPEIVAEAVLKSLEDWNKESAEMLSVFTTQTTEHQMKFQSNVLRNMLPADEFSRALPSKGITSYTVAAHLQHAQTGNGLTRMAAAAMTVKMVADETYAAMIADAYWQRNLVWSALFSLVSWAYPDPKYGTLTIEPLANGDGTLYQARGAALTGSDDTHQLAQAAAIADGTDPYPIIKEELLEHPENVNGTVVTFISTSLVATTQALAAFHLPEDPNIQAGDSADKLVGVLGFPVPGEILGYHADGGWIVHWRALPAGYMIAVAPSPAGTPPLWMRESETPELRGFQLVSQNTLYPLQESTWERIVGFAANNRVGALVYRIGDAGGLGSAGTYLVPTGYTAPIGN